MDHSYLMCHVMIISMYIISVFSSKIIFSKQHTCNSDQAMGYIHSYHIQNIIISIQCS